MAVVDSSEVFEAFPDGMVFHDAETGEILGVNERFCELLGYERSELIGADPSLFAGENTTSSYLPDDDWFGQTGRDEPIRHEWHAETASGDTLPVEVTVATTTRKDEQITVASIRERERDSASEQDRDRYRALFENDQLVIWEMDLSQPKVRVDHIAEKVEDVAAYLEANPEEHRAILERVRVTDVNNKAVEAYEADSREHLMESLGDVMTEKSIASWRDILAAVAAGETTFQTECTARTLAGDLRTVLFELVVPESCWDDYSSVYLIAIDTTDRKNRKRELEVARETRTALQRSLAESAGVDAFADAVCVELTAVDDVCHARAGVVGPGHETEPVGEAGDGAVRADLPVSDDEDPWRRAVRGGEQVHVPVSDDSADASAVLAVPVSHEGTIRGVLEVTLAAEQQLSDDHLTELATEAADSLARAIAGAERRRALAADDRTEVTIGVETTDSPLSQLAAAAETTATVSTVLPREDGVLCYLSVPTRTEAFLAAARAREKVGMVERLDDEGADRLQVLVDPPVPSTVLAEHGGLVVESQVDATTTTVVARFPRDTAYDPVLDALGDTFEDVWVAGFTTDPTETGARDPALALTDRQQEVLAAAFGAGYFEEPRERSASELAADLGITRQTFTEILHSAQRNVFATMFTDAD